MRRAIDRQLEKRLRAHNEAQLLIERHKTTRGAPVVPVAQKRSRTLLDPVVSHANEKLKQIDQQIELAQKDYATALEDLKDALAQRTP